MASILVVCTGNVCRSPIAEGLLRAALRSRLGDRAPEVFSAGTAGWEGSGAEPRAIQAAAERGVDIAAHRARRLRPEDVRRADVVLGMTAGHRDAIASTAPDAAGKTFTLKELVRLLEALPDRAPSAEPDGMVASRVAEADALRRGGFEGVPSDEDVADPLGMPPEAFRAVAWELEGWCRRLADALVGRAPAPAEAGAGGR